jgi:hypothetical protein
MSLLNRYSLYNVGRSLVATGLVLMIISALQFSVGLEVLSNLSSQYAFLSLLSGTVIVAVTVRESKSS